MSQRLLWLLLLLLPSLVIGGEEKSVKATDSVFYDGRWVTKEFKENSEKGLVLYKGKWMPEAEMYEDKGYVKHLGTWISPYRLKTILSRQAQARERIKFASDWKNAWKYQTRQGHFLIISNVSPELVQEIGLAMEQCYAELSKVFGVKNSIKNIKVEIYATQKQFMKHSADAGIPMNANVLGYFYWGSDMGIRAFYAGSLEQTLSTLFHECTHLVIRQVCGDIPTWANEGLAVFFESAERDKKGMKLETIPFNRLWSLKAMMEKKDISLNHLCKLQGMGQYTVEYYPQGWSLIYFLFYAEKGKYRRPFAAFYKNLASGKFEGNSIALFAHHFGSEPDGMKEKWKEFITSLEPQTTDQLVAAAIVAYTDYIDFASAQNFASKALAKMKGDDENVLLCNARLHLTLGRWVDEPERKAMHFAKSVEFFERVFPPPESGKRTVGYSKATASFASDRLDYARACIGAVKYERAQDLIEEVLTRKEFEFSAEAYSILAYLAVMAKDPAFHSLELAKENADLAEDLGADQENNYVKAQIALAEGNKNQAIKLLNEAASRDEFGFGGQFYRREIARLSGKLRKGSDEARQSNSGK